MGLKVETDMAVFKGKTMVDFRWNEGNEYTVVLEDKNGDRNRVRIPAYMVSILEQYWAMVSFMEQEQAA